MTWFIFRRNMEHGKFSSHFVVGRGTRWVVTDRFLVGIIQQFTLSVLSFPGKMSWMTDTKWVQLIGINNRPTFNPLPDMPILGSSNSNAKKDLLSKIYTNGDTVISLSWKHCGKRRNCSLRAISPSPTMFSKAVCCRCVKMTIYGVKD